MGMESPFGEVESSGKRQTEGGGCLTIRMRLELNVMEWNTYKWLKQ